MKKVFTIILLFFLSYVQVFSQPTRYFWDRFILGNVEMTNNSPVSGIISNTTQATSSSTYYLVNSESYANKWSNTSTPYNSEFTLTWGGGSHGGYDGVLLIATTINRYYTLQINGLSYSNRQAVLMETDNTPQSFFPNPSTAVSTPGAVYPGQDVTITITLDGNKSSQEKVFIRYSLDNWSNSKVVEATGFGHIWSTANATIPASDNSASNTVKYYAYSTTVSATNSSNHDLITLKLANNSGSNYSYTVNSSWATTSDGNWSSASTWVAGAVPVNGQPVTIAHDVTLDQNVTVSSAAINTGKTLTISTGNTLQTGGALTITGALSVSGSLQINSGGYIATNAPTYNMNSTLYYNTGASTFNRSAEWSSGSSDQGVPYNVTVNGGSTINMDIAGTTADARTVRGAITLYGSMSFKGIHNGGNGTVGGLTINGDLIISGGTLTLGHYDGSNGSDLILYGNWTRPGGSFVGNGRAVFMDGTTSTAITTNTATVINYLYIRKTSSASVTLNNELQIANTGTINSGATLNCGTYPITGAGTFTVSAGATLGIGSNAGITSSGLTGNIQTTGRTFAVGGNYTYNGSSAQVTGNGLPTTVNNLTVNNSSGLTFSGNVQVNGTLSLISGAISLNTKVFSYGTNGTLQYGGTEYTTTSDAELPSSGGPKNLIVTSTNSSGLSLHATRTLAGDLTIAASQKFIIPDTKSLTVTGNLTNYGGNAGLVINSSASGTGCLIHNSGDVPGTVNRYFTGSAESWHLISSPVYGQTITGDFTPTGSYGDGTGYDLYAWYESSGVWVNYKNSTVSPTWTLVNGNNNFAPIRGYLASYQAANPTKAFAGLMNSGAVSISLSKFGTGTYAGYNLFGNPYPSPIDWKASGGWIRSYLVNNGGGYDISIWNNTDGNYGVYNSASISDNGTHGATRYIPVGQGFFVKASAGAQPFGMDNDVRVSQNPAFLKSSEELSNVLRLRVTGTANTYSDEAIIEFGHENATGGGTKLFSMYTTAPSLYITKAGEDYSIDFRGEPASMNIPLNFIAGVDGSYTLTASQFETFSQGTVITVEDLKELRTQVLTQNPVYTYNALTTDDHTRFVLHFGGTFSTGDIKDQNPLNLYTSGNKVYIAGTSGQALSGDVFVYNLMGQQLHQQKLSGGSLSEISLNVSTGYYIVKMVTDRQTLTSKVFIK